MLVQVGNIGYIVIFLCTEELQLISFDKLLNKELVGLWELEDELKIIFLVGASG